MALLTTLLAAAAAAALREGDPPEAKRTASRTPAPAIIIEGPATPRWTITPDPVLARRYAPRDDRRHRGIVIRF